MNPGLQDLNNLCLQTCSNTEQAHKSMDLLFLCSSHSEICSWQRRADIPWVYCNILSNSSGYFVILCVISRMHSGTPLRLTRELLLCCCEQKVYSLHIWEQKYDVNFFLSWAAYFYKVLKLFILLQQFFEDIHSLHVMAAELSIHILHFLGIFIWKLGKRPKVTDTGVCLRVKQHHPPTCWSRTSPIWLIK